MLSYCSWCSKETKSNEITSCKCDHNLCPSCHLTGHACQSSCPLCWYYFSEELLIKENLCSSCLEPSNEINEIDDKGHKLCKSCSQCLLCSFRKEIGKEFFSLSYREHETRIQKILYHMQMCVQTIEIDQQTLINSEYSIMKPKTSSASSRYVYQIHDESKSKRMRIDRNGLFIHFGSANSPMDIN